MNEAPPLFRGPQVSPIEALHRHDGYISFALKREDDWRPAFAMRASELRSIFPQFRDQLLKDSFVSLNASWRLDHRASKNAFGYPAHSTENLRYLCACYCDIDSYKKGLEYHEDLKDVNSLSASGKLPWPSSIVSSGRGMWLLWFLHDEQNPMKAHLGAYSDSANNHLQLYAKINRAIVQRLSFLGSDPAATDAARYLRVPGSFRMDTEEIVEWTVQERDGHVLTYTLKALGDFFGVTVRQRFPQDQAALAEPRMIVGKRGTGYRAANRNKLAAFNTLKDLRAGGFVEGCRNNAALIYAACLKWNGIPREKTMCELLVMAQQCTPPLSSRECAGAVKSAYKRLMKRMSYQWIADVLRITPAEAAAIAREIGKPFPSERVGGGELQAGAPPLGESRNMKRTVRRLEISRIAETMKGVPSYRELQRKLLDLGIDVGHVTVGTDMRALGLKSAARAGAPRRKYESTHDEQSALFPLMKREKPIVSVRKEEEAPLRLGYGKGWDGFPTPLYAMETEQF